MFAFQQRHSPLHRGVTLDDLGGAGLYLLSDLSTGVTGEIHFVDSGYNVIAMPHPDALRADHKAQATRSDDAGEVESRRYSFATCGMTSSRNSSSDRIASLNDIAAEEEVGQEIIDAQFLDLLFDLRAHGLR